MALSIRRKILTAFLTATAIFFVIVALAVVYNQTSVYKTLTIVDSVHEEMTMLASLRGAMEQALMPANDYIITGDRRYEADFKKESEVIERLLTKTEEMLMSDEEYDSQLIMEEREILMDVRVSWKNINALSMRIFAIQRPVGSRVAAALMEEMDYKWGRPAVKRLARWGEIETGDLKDAMKKINDALMRSWLIICAALAALTVVGVFIGSYFSKRFVSPIKDLCYGAERIAGGDFDFRVDVSTGDELGQLADRFNAMGARLKESYSVLEEKVRERTKDLERERAELRDRIDELERFVKVAVDREARMKDLFEEIERLKKEGI